MLSSRLRRLLGTVFLFAGIGLAQQPAPKSIDAHPENDAQPQKPVASQQPDEAPADAQASPAIPQPGRTAGQNLLGQADTARGEGRRNENVQINLVDNNAARDAATATIVEEFLVDRNYFSAEYGNAARGPIHVQPQSGAGIHGNVFWSHNNSVFSARTFFQAGPVEPRTHRIGRYSSGDSLRNCDRRIASGRFSRSVCTAVSGRRAPRRGSNIGLQAGDTIEIVRDNRVIEPSITAGR